MIARETTSSVPRPPHPTVAATPTAAPAARSRNRHRGQGWASTPRAWRLREPGTADSGEQQPGPRYPVRPGCGREPQEGPGHGQRQHAEHPARDDRDPRGRRRGPPQHVPAVQRREQQPGGVGGGEAPAGRGPGPARAAGRRPDDERGARHRLGRRRPPTRPAGRTAAPAGPTARSRPAPRRSLWNTSRTRARRRRLRMNDLIAAIRGGPAATAGAITADPGVATRPSEISTSRAPAAAAKSRSWVAMTTVPPCPAYSRSRPASSFRNPGSRLCSGSSSSSSRLGRASAAASDSRCRWPEDRSVGTASARPASPNTPMSSSAGRHQPRTGSWVSRTSSRCSCRLSPGYQVGSSATRATARQNAASSRGSAGEHGHRPGRRPVQPGQAGQQRRLAGAIDAGHGDDLAAGYGQVHVLEHREAAVAHPHAAYRHRRPSHSLTVSPRPTSRGRWHPEPQGMWSGRGACGQGA